MPINVDPKLIDAIVQRQAQTAPAPVAEKKDGSVLANILWAAGGAADAGSTLYGLHKGSVHENNPLVNWAPKNAQVPMGAAMEVGTMLLLDKILGKNHPKVMKAAKMGLGALHGGLAVKNLSTIASAERDRKATPAPSQDSVPSNLVKHPDGYYYDPTLFPQTK